MVGSKGKAKRVAIYTRVSTDHQTMANQERELREVAERADWEVVKVYADRGISGAKGRDKRPALDAMLKDATARRFDMIAAWSVDRLGRSLQHLITLLGDIHAVGVDLYLHQQAIDTTTPAGKALFQMMGVFAEFERAIIVERVKSGLARAEKEGTKSGKAIGRPTVGADVEAGIRAALASGKGIRKVAREVGVGVSVVQRVAAAEAA
jgi:DNA invertase Pin-like site-specific DNA recombinase